MLTNEEYENHLADDEPKWFAIRTNYKREKLVRKYLGKKEVEAYLPINKVTRRWERKVRKVELPLINCYLFVKITKSEYIKVLETENVLNFVRFSKNLISIPDEEIELLKRITGEYEDIEIAEVEYEEGDDVEIIAGNLTGLKGKLIEKNNTNKFKVKLEYLNYFLLLEVEKNLLRKIGQRRNSSY